MNPIGFVFRWMAEMLCRTPLRRLVINNAYAKLLIITGGLQWHDLPHLHHPLIHLKMDLEWRKEMSHITNTDAVPPNSRDSLLKEQTE